MTAIERSAGYLHTPTPGFEYPQRDLPAHFRFVGMMPGDRPAHVPEPDFWGELAGSRPVVHVTQGTIVTEAPDLFRPALEGLAREDLLTVVSTGNPRLLRGRPEITGERAGAGRPRRASSSAAS